MKQKSYQIRKDDRVMVIRGKEKGKIGKVLKVLPKKDRVVIEKINMVKSHARASANVTKGGILEKEGSIHISNVLLMCPKCAEPVRVAHKGLEDGSRVRACGKCGETLDG